MKKKYILSIILINSLLVLTSCSSNNSNATAKPNSEKSKQQSIVESKVDETKDKAITQNASDKKTNNDVKNVTETIAPKINNPSVDTTVKPTNPLVQSKNKIIVIDPGHANKSNLETEQLSPGSSVMKIKDGGGAEGVATKNPEYLINMKVSLKLKTLLEAGGFTVIMTKTDNSLSLGNVDRANIGNNANANLVIRIHADSSDNSGVTGASMLVPATLNEATKAIHDESTRCGAIVLSTMVNEVGMKNRGVVEHSDMTGFNWSKVPVILVEMGFLSNSNEDLLLSSDEYQNKIAKGLCDGIIVAEK